ncbi:glycosyltransferase [Yunchengibacter salinarum]|uniref:glycosyltransferase n=1 Tax=Yunchengibacter salinarum TaxID=3133399 RepID=UPI0035B5E9A5
MTTASLHLVFCIDAGFAPHMAATLESVRRTTPGPLVAHVLHGGLAADEAEGLNAMAGAGLAVHLYDLGPGAFADAMLGDALAERLSVATYYRFALARVLPKTVTRVLYMDADMIALESLRPLYDHTDLQGHVVAAVSETKLEPRGQGRLLGTTRGRYFSAGLMLVDMDAWRSARVEQALMDQLHSGHRFDYNDQDILNLVLDGRVLYLGQRYNVQTHSLHDGTAPADPAIMHFTGPEKPWRRSCVHPYRQAYRDARDATPFTPWAPDLYLDRHDHALIEHVARNVAPNARLALYGAGERGRRLMLALTDRLPGLRMIAMLDRDVRGAFDGVPIRGDMDFATVDHVVITSAAFADEIAADLRARGVPDHQVIRPPRPRLNAGEQDATGATL